MLVPLIATVIIGALLYKLLLSDSNKFWKQNGIKEIDTSPALGSLDILLGRKAMTDSDDYAYIQMGTTDKFCGVMDMSTPLLLVKDMELIKKILIKDFDHFVDRRQFFHKEDGTLTKILFTLEGDEWKSVRSQVSPTFTTGKIRRMMEYFNSVGMEWTKEFTRQAKSNPKGSVNINVQKAVNQYTIEVISTTVFGMNAGVIKDSESIFNKMANRIADFNKKQVFKLSFRLKFPKLSKYLGLTVFDMESLTFFENLLEQALKSRMSGETKRNDFLQLLVEAKKGELKAAGSDELSSFEKDALLSTDSLSKTQYFTDRVMLAQCIQFFFAGFSTTSNFLAFALYSLALNQGIQDKLRQEVNKIVKEDGSFDYDDVGQLVYLDMVVCEVLRKFPAVARLERMCAKDYSDPESGLKIPKGTFVGIPVHAIHHDKQYYDNPDEFDPEHFSPENKAKRNFSANLPFGSGPRNCIGMRFALIEVKSALAHMVHGFKIGPTAKTPFPLKGQPAGLSEIPPKNLELELTPLTPKKK